MNTEYFNEIKELADMNDSLHRQTLEDCFCEAFGVDDDFGLIGKMQRTPHDELYRYLNDNSVKYCIEDSEYIDDLDDDEKAIMDKAVSIYEEYGVDAIIDALMICVGREDEVKDRLTEEADIEPYQEPNDVNYEDVWSRSHLGK